MSAEAVDAVLDRTLRLRAGAPALTRNIGDDAARALGGPATGRMERRLRWLGRGLPRRLAERLAR